MILIAFVDDSGGMMFNHRRQSRDSVALARILDMTTGSTLWMNEYSAPLFTEYSAPQIQVDAQFLDKAGPEDYCFVESVEIAPYLLFIEKIILFHWNRAYPSDMKFPINLDSGKWRLVSTEDFPGSSHDKITVEVYTK